jgi:hypothetical protein
MDNASMIAVQAILKFKKLFCAIDLTSFAE